MGPQTTKKITDLGSGQLFIIEYPSISGPHSQSQSLISISRSLFDKQEKKKLRHQQERGTPSGITYENDLVIYLAGISEETV